MHRDFADWYRAATVDLRTVDLEKRWQAIENLEPSLDSRKALDLVRMYFGRPAKESKFVEDFRSAFKTADPTFPMRGNDLELQILAGGTIVHVLEKRSGQIADCAALAMVTADYYGKRAGRRAVDLIEHAVTCLAKRSEELRRFEGELAFSAPNPWQKEQLDTLVQAFNEGNVPALGEHVVRGLKSLESALGKLATRTRDAQNQLLKLQRRHEEELDILWWVFGGYSRDLDKPIAELTTPGVCIILGKELADLTRFVPGPLAARAFLDKMLSYVNGAAESATLKEAVNGTPKEWRIGWLGNSDLVADDLAPVLLAVKASLTTEGEETWIPVFEKAAGIKANRKTTMIDLAEQVYRECLLFRKLVNGES